ncbi:SAF domain-containing protein [Antricoccus suffuscus]|nr:SAF domain-containing protein [Antricoccus suffuscus]
MGFARMSRSGRRRSRHIRGRRPRGTAPALLLRRFAAVALLITATLLFIRPATARDAAGAATTEVAVVVAARDLEAGASIEPDMLTQKKMPAALAPTGADVSAGDLIGAHTLGAVRSGEVITDARIAELALSGGPAHGLPLGLVPVVVHITDPNVISTMTIGMCLDLYAGEPGAPLDLVASGLYLAAILDDPSASNTTTATGGSGNSASQNMRYVVLGVPSGSTNNVASSTSLSLMFATVCADVVNQ